MAPRPHGRPPADATLPHLGEEVELCGTPGALVRQGGGKGAWNQGRIRSMHAQWARAQNLNQ